MYFIPRVPVSVNLEHDLLVYYELLPKDASAFKLWYNCKRVIMFPISLSSKRARLALRFFTYGVMTLATVMLTILAILYAMGNRFDTDTFSFEQGGLVQFRSAPDGARVVIDGKVQNFTTPGRANLTAGVHAVAIQKEGYRSWEKTISLGAGQLLWLNYARLIPNSVTTAPLRALSGMSDMLPSPDKRWLLLQEATNQPALILADIGNERNLVYSSITMPDAQFSKPSGAFGHIDLTEWDLGSRYFLVHHYNDAVNEWLRVDRSQPGQAVNISRLFGLAIADAHFAGSNPNIVYAKTDNVLRRLDLGANSASAALVSGLQQFSVYGDDSIAYVAEREVTSGNPASKQKIVGIFKQNKESVIKTYPTSASVMIAFGEYDNHSYLAVRKDNEKIQILRDPTVAAAKDTTVFATLDIGKPVTQMLFSNNGRMLVAGANDLLTTYDLELARTYSQPLPFLSQPSTRPLRWLDDYYLWSDTGDRLRTVEFDGQNERELTSVAPGFDICLSQSGETLYSIGKNAITSGYFLQASQLIVR